MLIMLVIVLDSKVLENLKSRSLIKWILMKANRHRYKIKNPAQ
ncbi:hypothetical protein BsLM_0166 [Bacillus sp. LM 4-2]|nr:hypothetical protein BsLM_0166 [Bacillus sp. LM 4-2]